MSSLGALHAHSCQYHTTINPSIFLPQTLRISRLREVEVNASSGKLFQREMVAGRKE